MGIVNHLLDADRATLFHAVAYGKHLVAGNLTKSNVTGSDGTHVITVQQMLGRGPWDGCEGLWWNGLEIKSDKYRFYPGDPIAAVTPKTYTADNTTEVFTCTGHGFENGQPIVLLPAVGGSLPSPLFANTVYYVRDKTTDTFKLAATATGSALGITTNGSGTLQLKELQADVSFPLDTLHNGVAWIAAELASGVGEFDTASTPPVGLTGIFRTTKCQDYDEDGDEDGSPVYTTNPALQVADLLINKGGIPKERIDWPAWCDWRDFCAENISYDYTDLGGLDGFGLTASYYNGTDFDTLVTQRVDPFVEFFQSSGSPGVGVDVDNFSAKFEGTIKPKFSETYTFYITHTHGAKVYVDNLSTPLIDEWSSTGTHSATIALTADTQYDIRVEWKHTTGDAELRLEWSAPSEAKEVVPPNVLFPKTVNRPRYETHPFFASPTRLDDAVRTILNLCNATYQEADGKLKFFCLDQLTTSGFRLRNQDIVDASISVRPRDVLSLRNVWTAKYRDIDSQYMDEPLTPITIERTELIEAAGRRIDGDTIELFNTTRHQAYRTLEAIVKRAVDPKYEIDLTAMPTAFKVLPGDVGGVDVDFLGWTNKKVLTLSAADSSSESTADERRLLFQEWTGQELTEPDLEDPTAPVLLSAVADSESAITITWSAATDDVAVMGYEYSRDGGAAVDVGNVLTTQDTGLTDSTEYSYRVRAYDAAGNRSEWSNLLSATTDAIPLFFDVIGVAPIAAFGLRKLNSDYAGSCLRVRRSSDNTEQDIGFDGESLDWAAATTFASGSDLFVRTWYDQSASAKNVGQATTTKQPKLDTSAEEVVFDGSDDELIAASNLGLSGNFAATVFAVGRMATNGRAMFKLGTVAALQMVGLYRTNSTSIRIVHAGSNDYPVTIVDVAGRSLLTYRKTPGAINTTSEIYQNGSLLTVSGTASTATPNMTDGTLTIGSIGGSTYLDGAVEELVVVGSALSSTPRGDGETDIMDYYGL